MIDYFNSMSTTSWLLMASVLWGIYIYLALYWKKNPVPMDVRELRRKYKSLQPVIASGDEKVIPIAEMYVYPVRGIRAGAQVDQLYLGMHGVMYDREVLLAAKEDKAVVTTNKYHEMGCLRQVLTGTVVTITSLKPERLRAKGQPESLTIDLKDDPESVGEFIEVQRGYFGY